MLAVLGLIDVVMISNLLVMVIVGGYETFVSRLNLRGHPDEPEWLSHVNASVLKIKLAMAIIGISSIHLLRTFIEAGSLGAPAAGRLHRDRRDVADHHPHRVHPVGDRHRRGSTGSRTWRSKRPRRTPSTDDALRALSSSPPASCWRLACCRARRRRRGCRLHPLHRVAVAGGAAGRRLARDLRRRHRGARAGLQAARPDAAGAAEDRRAGAGRIRPGAGRLSEGSADRAAGRRTAASCCRNTARRCARSSSASACRRPWCWRSGAARPTTAATGCPTTRCG